MFALASAYSAAYHQPPSCLNDHRRPALATRRGITLAKLAEPDVAPATPKLRVVHHSYDAKMVPTKLTPPKPPSPPADDDGLAEGRLLMLVVAMLWGTNFPAGKAILESGLSPAVAAAARFSVAAIALSPMLMRPIHDDEGGSTRMPTELVLGGLECGGWLALGYIAQAIALQGAPAGVVAFLASLQVVFVPLLLVLLGDRLTPRLAACAALCVSGVGLLEMGGGVADGAATDASLLALLQPLGFGTSYIRIEALMRRFPTAGLQLSALQLASNAAIALGWAAFELSANPDTAGELASLADGGVVAQLLYMGLFSTALTVLLQTRALGKLPAADSSVIVATEPLWAAGFAFLWLGERLEPSAVAGGLVLLSGCLGNTLLPPNFMLDDDDSGH